MRKLFDLAGLLLAMGFVALVFWQLTTRYSLLPFGRAVELATQQVKVSSATAAEQQEMLASVERVSSIHEAELNIVEKYYSELLIGGLVLSLLVLGRSVSQFAAVKRTAMRTSVDKTKV